MKQSMVVVCFVGLMMIMMTMINTTTVTVDHKKYVTCSSHGDPKYTTFDGTEYSFSGQCQYYLIKGSSPKFHVIQEDGPCSYGNNSCPLSLTISGPNGRVIVLHRGGSVTVEGAWVIPEFIGYGYKITLQGNTISVEGFQYIVQYDGENTINVLAHDPSRLNKVRGLCGDFDRDSADDFLTDDDILTTDPWIFGNSYRTDKNCLGPCSSSPCLNGGTCIQEYTSFRCDCLPVFTGPKCEESMVNTTPSTTIAAASIPTTTNPETTTPPTTTPPTTTPPTTTPPTTTPPTTSGPADISQFCLKCICEVESECSEKAKCSGATGNSANGNSCGPYRISKGYWEDAGSPGHAWRACVDKVECSETAVRAYLTRYATKARLAHAPTCEDFARIHHGGPTGYKSPSADAYWAEVFSCYEE